MDWSATEHNILAELLTEFNDRRIWDTKPRKRLKSYSGYGGDELIFDAL